MKQPKVSIIVPVYNSEQYLKDCLDSLTEQTLKEIEIICIDASSSDNSLKILMDYAEKDKRIIVLKHTYEYASASRNKAINISSGEYILFVDSDDMLFPYSCEYAYSIVKKEKCDLGIFNSVNIRNNQTDSLEFNLKDIIQQLPCNPCNISETEIDIFNLPNFIWNKIYRREFLIQNEILFDNLKFAEDTLFCTKSYLSALRSIFIDIPIYKYRRHNESSTFNFNKHYADLLEAYKHSYEYIKYTSNIHLQISFCKCVIHTLLCFFSDHPLSLVNKKKYYSEMRTFFLNINKDYFIDNNPNSDLFKIIIQTKEYNESITNIHNNPLQALKNKEKIFVYILGIKILTIRKKEHTSTYLLFNYLPIIKIKGGK